jgi:hypothetical protein
MGPVCPADLDYQGCVEGGYFNHFGTGQNGGGGSGGYCQNTGASGGYLYPSCNGVQIPCPMQGCVNMPGSNQYCYPPSRSACCDGTWGQAVVTDSCV